MITNTSLVQDAAPAATAPAVAPPMIEPILKLPLRLNVDGSMGNPTIDFGDAGATLHVIEQVNDGLLSQMIWHAPTAAAGLLCITPVVLLGALIRTAGRRQQFGHYYCRKCNYDMTGPGGMPPEASAGNGALPCPECGSDQKSRPARLGRSFIARVWKITACAVMLMLLCVGTLVAMLERSNPSNTWMTAWLEPISRAGLLPRLVHAGTIYGSSAQRVSVWTVPEGKRTVELRVHSAYQISAVTKDSEWFSWVQFEMETGGVLQTANLRTGARSTLSLSTKGPHNITLIAPSMKPGCVIVGYTNAMQRTSNEAVLVRIDVAKGTHEIIGQVPLEPGQLSSGGTFVFREQEGQTSWAYIAYNNNGSTGVLAGTVITARKQSFPFEQAGKWWTPPTMAPDGLSVEITAGGGTGTANALHILLADGSQTTIPFKANGYQASVAENGVAVEWQRGAAGGQLQVLAPDGKVNGVLSNSGGVPNLPVISRDGHWAAAPVTISKTTISGSAAFDPYVYVWDLSQLKPAK